MRRSIRLSASVIRMTAGMAATSQANNAWPAIPLMREARLIAEKCSSARGTRKLVDLAETGDDVIQPPSRTKGTIRANCSGMAA